MLTKRQNLIETIKGGNPDRFVKQFEYMGLIMGDPRPDERAMPGGAPVTSEWGVTTVWPDGTPGPFSMQDKEHLVVKDIEHWRDYVHEPKIDYPASAWEPFIAQAEQIDKSEVFPTVMVAPGLLEMSHHLCEIKNCMMYFITNPDEMHDLIAVLTDYELQLAEAFCTYFKPEAVFHHDDWGSAISTFISPDMFAEFFLDSAKQIYGYYKDHGVKLVIHHSDSYAATLVPYMIEMGIDIWQGTMSTNDIPDLIEKYGGQISFMGGIDSGVVDKEGWTPELIESVVRKECTECGTHYFIPNAIQGLPMSTFPGVYQCIDEKIDLMSVEMFGTDFSEAPQYKANAAGPMAIPGAPGGPDAGGPGMPPAGGPGMPPAGGPGMPPAGGLK